jgi:hypothetical protein
LYLFVNSLASAMARWSVYFQKEQLQGGVKVYPGGQLVIWQTQFVQSVNDGM